MLVELTSQRMLSIGCLNVHVYLLCCAGFGAGFGGSLFGDNNAFFGSSSSDLFGGDMFGGYVFIQLSFIFSFSPLLGIDV